jgi:hypothetical protein
LCLRSCNCPAVANNVKSHLIMPCSRQSAVGRFVLLANEYQLLHH